MEDLHFKTNLGLLKYVMSIQKLGESNQGKVYRSGSNVVKLFKIPDVDFLKGL